MQQYLEEFNSTLVKLGWVYENPDARWACAALPVKKPSGGYRQTTDYKPVNAQVEPLAGLMPNLDVDLERVAGSRCFGLFDFIKGYWQLPLHPESQEVLSYMTHRRIYTPRRVPQGCSDAALYFQATMERCFAPLLLTHMLVWIDDLLLYSADVDTYLAKLDELLRLADSFGFKLSATKSCVYKREVKWCGKLITGEGELQQFICSSNWMRNSIVDYARLVRPLQEKFDTAMQHARRRTKRIAKGIPITLTSAEQEAFSLMKDAIANSSVLAFPDPSADMCLLTDASDEGWAVIVTQVTQEVVEHVAAQGIMLAVAKLLDHRWNPSKRHHELLVSWKGLEPIEDSWESLKSLAKDIPVLVKAYAETHGDKSLRQALSKLLA
ncbi:hypothetical protein ATCC90586_008182 [Pythium insidiosum]|nr:hypothetical protein ATCC90586_008182 [Pythium insidiosum]